MMIFALSIGASCARGADTLELRHALHVGAHKREGNFNERIRFL